MSKKNNFQTNPNWIDRNQNLYKHSSFKKVKKKTNKKYYGQKSYTTPLVMFLTNDTKKKLNLDITN